MDFGEILKNWEETRKEKKSSETHRDFGDILRQWSVTHDDTKEIERRSETGSNRIQQPTITQLHRMRIQDELDLHGCTLEEALESTGAFIEQCRSKRLCKVRIITGKGLHSPNGQSVVREPVIQLVRHSPHVREVNINPKAEDGGSGALILILKPAVQNL